MPVLSNSKHERFAQEIAKGASASVAFVTAGYAKNDGNASRLRGNEKVQCRIEEIQGAAAEAVGLTIQWVLNGLRLNYDRAMQHEEIRNADGGTGEYRYDGAVANKALELVGKHLGMFKDKVEHSGPGGQPMSPPVFNVTFGRSDGGDPTA